MDFHALSRKELQSLCKKNKIPANITNIAMADALQALEKVEGLDEFTNAAISDLEQSSRKKAMHGSPEIPRTACRTSTRRKPINVGTENSQTPLTRTRRTTRKTEAREADQENINLNLPGTPAVPAARRRAAATSASRKKEAKAMESVEDENLDGEEKKNNVPETPVAQSSRKRAPPASTWKKLEAQREEKSVQRVTRQSVRLLEKSLAELSLKEKGRIQPLKIDGLCTESGDIEVKNESDVDLLSVLEKSSEKSNDPQFPLCQNLDQSLESEREPQEDSSNDEHQLEDCNAKQEVGSKLCDNSEDLSFQNLDHSLESEREIKHELREGSTNDEQKLEHCDAKQEIDSKLCDNSEDLPCQTVDQSLESKVEINTELQEDSSKDEHQLEDCNANQGVGSKLRDNSEDLSFQNLDHSLESEREIKHELQEGSTNDEQQLEHCNAKQEIYSKLCDNSEDLPCQTVDQSLGSKVEINTELQEDSNSNDDNECSDEPNTLPDEESLEKAVLNQESIIEKGPNNLITENSGTYWGTDLTEDRQHGDYDPHSNFAIEVESDSAETFQEKTLLLPEDACNEASENRCEDLSAENDNEALVDVDVMKAEELDITFQKSHTSCDLDETQSLHSVRSAATEDLSAEYDNEALVDIDVMKADELGITFQKSHTSCDLDETHDLATDNVMVPFKDLLVEYNNQEIDVMEAGELDMIDHKSHKSQDSDELSGSVSQMSPFSTLDSEVDAIKMHQHSSSETSVEELAVAEHDFPPALDKTPASSKQTSPYQPLVAGGTTVKGTTGLSPFAADTLQGQFPRPTEKSSAKKLPTVQKMTDASDINKENVDNSGRKVEPKKDKANKKVIDEKIAEVLSVRQLRKMLKEELQIANNSNETKDAKQQVGKARLPLQTLPENCMPAAAESEN